MAQSLYLYRISEDERCIQKTLINSGANSNRVTTASANFKQGHDILKPVFTVQSSSSLMKTVNYMYNSSTGKYYFVDSVVIKPTSIFELHCHEDVLMTYVANLKALTCTLDRSETIFNGYLPDSEYTALGYRAITCKAFPKALDNDSYILMTTG